MGEALATTAEAAAEGRAAWGRRWPRSP